MYYVRTYTHDIGYEFVGDVTWSGREPIGVTLVEVNDAPATFDRETADQIVCFLIDEGIVERATALPTSEFIGQQRAIADEVGWAQKGA
jgi:hypothetical protein